MFNYINLPHSFFIVLGIGYFCVVGRKNRAVLSSTVASNSNRLWFRAIHEYRVKLVILFRNIPNFVALVGKVGVIALVYNFLRGVALGTHLENIKAAIVSLALENDCPTIPAASRG